MKAYLNLLYEKEVRRDEMKILKDFKADGDITALIELFSIFPPKTVILTGEK